jgi:transcription elongation factor
LPEDEQESYNGGSRGSSSIIESIKNRTAAQEQAPREDPAEGAPVGRVRATVESSKLREILNNQFGDDEDQ